MMFGEGIGDRFQQETKYFRDRMSGRGLDWSKVPPKYKKYVDSHIVRLPDPVPPDDMPLDRIIRIRKSVRHFTERPLELGQLSYLLWASSGIQRVEGGHEFRTIPSAGALYPIETYIVANNIKDLARGVYHYSIREHLLEQIELGDYRGQITRVALGQRMCADASAVFVWTAIFYRSKWKYEQRAYRYIYLDAGHMAQNLTLAAISLGLGSCPIGALFDEEANMIVGIDGIEESVIYLAVVGIPR